MKATWGWFCCHAWAATRGSDSGLVGLVLCVSAKFEGNEEDRTEEDSVIFHEEESTLQVPEHSQIKFHACYT